MSGNERFGDDTKHTQSAKPDEHTAGAHASWMTELSGHNPGDAQHKIGAASDKTIDEKTGEIIAGAEKRLLLNADELAKINTPEQNLQIVIDSLNRAAKMIDKLEQNGFDVKPVVAANFYGGLLDEGKGTPENVKALLHNLKSYLKHDGDLPS